MMAEIFQPVRGLEENINKITNHDGYIYFAYDTGNIYLDKDGQRHLMGGDSTGFVWADAKDGQIIKVVADDEENQTYYIYIDAIENNSIPKPNSLILNSDGRFFRTSKVEASQNRVLANLIAVSGSGESSGSSSNINELTMTWQNIDTIGSTYVFHKNNEIIFIPNSEVDDTYSLSVILLDSTGNEVYQQDFRQRNKLKCIINTNDFPVGRNMTLRCILKSDNSTYNGSRGRIYNFTPINVLEMAIEKPTNINMIGIQTGSVRLSYIPYFTGLWTTRNPVKIYYNIDGNDGIFKDNLAEGNDKNRQYIEIPHQAHGTHIIGLWLGLTINNKEYTTDPIYYEVPFVDSGNEDAIIWIQDELKTVVQYEPAVINYMVYNSIAAATGANIEVQFLQDGVLFDSVEITYGTRWIALDLTARYVVGENHFSIVSGGTRKDINFTVTSEGARNLDLVHNNELKINFSSMGRSNKQIKANRANFVSSAEPYAAKLNNFNWYNNGWLNDNDGNGSYLAISNGASVEIPMSNITIGTTSQPWTFEMRFRIRNAKKFATLVTEIPIYVWENENGERCGTGKELTLEEIEAIPGASPIRDSDGNLVMNAANTTRKIIRSDKYIAFRYLTTEYNQETNKTEVKGFAIGTQEAYFSVGGKVVNVKYRENEIINISFVVDKAQNQLSIYLNGILSGVADLSGVRGFPMADTVSFLINSEYCDFDLYNFRVYPLALTMPEIIHNYIADMKNVDLYDENQLTDINDDTKLSYAKLLEYNESHVDNPTMPYVVIDMSGETSTGTDELPYSKTSKGINGTRIEFVNPTGDYLLREHQITDWDYYTHSPSYTADNVNINVQGTSSQIYPRRNFKTKFKKAKNWIFTQGPLAGKPVNYEYYFETDGSITKEMVQQCVNLQNIINTSDEEDEIRAKKSELKALGAGKKKLAKKWHLDSEVHSTDKFTWKIDYMESSGSYNTGFANLMGSGIYSKHPLEDLGYSGEGFRTSVYGFPMLAFHKTVDGKYTYIGRYNYNLDKSSNEYYGFEEEIEQPNITLTKTVDDGEGGTTTKSYHPLIADIAECWELRDNQGSWCSFRYPNATRTLGFRAPISDTDPGIEVVKHFEARYNKKADQFEWGQNVIIGKTNDEDYSSEVGNDKNTINNYLLNKLTNLEILFNWLDSTDTQSATNKPLNEVIGQDSVVYKVNGTVPEEEEEVQGVRYSEDTSTGTSIIQGTFTKDSTEYRRQKFYAEFDLHLDKHYCAIYFIMTELLLCYDSRGKNMMIASFGPTATSQGNYVWYPIFYDIDTQLGLNNVGAKLWDYDEDCTENGTFSTAQSVLWTNFNDLFKSQIISTYRQLRGSGEDGQLSYKNIEGAYTCDPEVFKSSTAMRGRRPIIAIGLDEYYKYVLPVTERWKAQDGSYTTANYLYACQGDRKLSRELLINNRLLYMDSKWLGGTFTISSGGMAGIMFRSTANHEISTSDKYVDLINPEGYTPGDSYSTTIEDPVNHQISTHVYEYQPYQKMKYFDSTPQYNVTPFLNFYVTTFVDENIYQNDEPYNEDKYPKGIPTKVLPSVQEAYQYGRVDQQLNYFAGSQYISSMGDLSTKYVNQVKFPNTPHLLDITLGSDAPGYFNNENLNPFELYCDVDDATGKVKEASTKSLLTKIILSNLRGLNTFLDVRSPDKLTEFRALGTSLTYALFAEGAPLNTVHLPDTTQRIIFIQNKNLNKILKTEPVVATMVDGDLIYEDHETYEGLYIEGLTDYDPISGSKGLGSNVSEIDIEGDSMRYDSYTILNNLVLQKKPISPTQDQQRLSIKMLDVNWSPYTQVEYGESKNSNIQYYKLTDHSTYELYNSPSSEWENDTLNGKIFTFDESIPKATISDLSLLDTFLDDYNSTPSGSINQFTNNIESEMSNKTYPAISGQLFVANGDADIGIKETDLSNIYAVAWPNLVIRAEKIEKSFLTKYIEIDPNSGREIVLDDKAFGDENIIKLSPASRLKKPTRAHYDFKGFSPIKPPQNPSDLDELPELYVVRTEDDNGWKLTPEGEAAIIDDVTKIQILYAIFAPTLYKMSYYYNDENETLIETIYCPYSQDNGSVQQPSMIPMMDESELPLRTTYAFLGYTEDKEHSENLVDFKLKKANRNMNFYAVFKETTVSENILSAEYFDVVVNNSGYQDRIVGGYGGADQLGIIDGHYNVAGPTGEIKLKDNIVLTGKITLPAQAEVVINNEKQTVWITGIAKNGFSIDNNKITHVFFESNNKYRIIREKAFYCDQNSTSDLKYVDFENSDIRIIESEAFVRCQQLNSYIMPPHLIDIQGGAFANCFDKKDDIVIKIGSEILRLGTYAFSNNMLGNNTQVWIGSPDKGAPLNLQYTHTINSSSLVRINQGADRFGIITDIYFWSSRYFDLEDSIGDEVIVGGVPYDNQNVSSAFYIGSGTTERPRTVHVTKVE